MTAVDRRKANLDLRIKSAVENTTCPSNVSQKADLELKHGHLKVEDVSPEFTGVDVEGAFFEVRLDFRQPTEYYVFADFRFGNVRLPDDLEVIKNVKDYTTVKLEMKTSKATTESPIIRVKGPNGKLFID